MRDSQKITLLIGIFILCVVMLWYGPLLIPLLIVSLTTALIISMLAGLDPQARIDPVIATMVVMYTVLIGLGILTIYIV